MKILVNEASHEPATGENIFHFRYAFHLKSQPIQKSIEMIFSLIIWQVYIEKEACHETTRHK